MKRLVSFLILSAFAISSCVAPKLYNETKSQKAKCEKDNEALTASNLALTTKVGDLTSSVQDLRNQVDALVIDTAKSGNELRNLKESYNKLNSSYQSVLKEGPASLSDQEATRKLIRDLQKTQENLQAKEDQLRMKVNMLQNKKDSLDVMGNELRAKDMRLEQLEKLLSAKDSSVKALHSAVEKAMVGFKDKGLSVEMKNGKVYVMLEERLLFASASTEVDPKGVDALRELGKVLEKNPDINVMIEGHTDNVPMHGAGEIKDNWDLSVMRATAVVKIILANSKTKPVHLTAAGRSEFSPIDNTNSVEGRKKNRRIEVILTPKLDEIFKVLDSN